MEPTRTILHPTDFSDASRYAFRVACSLARDRGARLLVLHVAPPPVEGVPRAADYLEGLWNDLRQLQDEHPRARLKHLLREGDPTTEIPHVAEELHCELIVMGTHGWARGERLLMGSVAHEVFSKAPCLLVIVRPPFPDTPVPVASPAEGT